MLISHLNKAEKKLQSKENTKIVNCKGVHYLDSPMLISKMILELQDRRPLLFIAILASPVQLNLPTGTELGNE